MGSVEREVVAKRHAAARSKRKLFPDPTVLLEVARYFIDFRRRTDALIADSQTTHLAGCGHIAFKQSRGHREHVGVVVETVPEIVARQERSTIDVEREHVAECVDVLGAVQTMDGRS